MMKNPELYAGFIAMSTARPKGPVAAHCQEACMIDRGFIRSPKPRRKAKVMHLLALAFWGAVTLVHVMRVAILLAAVKIQKTIKWQKTT
jgi:hypothetical protein